jgi:hypothetical protein
MMPEALARHLIALGLIGRHCLRARQIDWRGAKISEGNEP